MAFLDQIYIIMHSNTYSYADNIFWKVVVSSFCHHQHRKQSNHGVNSHFPVVSMLPFLARQQWQKPVVLSPRRQSRTLTYLREVWTTYGDLIWKKKVFKIHIFLGDRRESWVVMSTLLLRKSRFRSQHPHWRDHSYTQLQLWGTWPLFGPLSASALMCTCPHICMHTYT